MPAFNTKFDLDRNDVELIETALHDTIRELSIEQLGRASCDQTVERIKETKELLGRLHNQKVVYRPSHKLNVGG